MKTIQIVQDGMQNDMPEVIQKQQEVVKPLQPEIHLVHENILLGLLAEIKPVDIAEVLNMLPEEKVETRHVVVAVVKHLLKIAKDKNWGLCQKYDFTYIYNGAYWKQYTRADIKNFFGM